MTAATKYGGVAIKTYKREDLIDHLSEFHESQADKDASKHVKITKVMWGQFMDEIESFIWKESEKGKVKLFDTTWFPYIKSATSSRTQSVPGKSKKVTVPAKPAHIVTKVKVSQTRNEKLRPKGSFA